MKPPSARSNRTSVSLVTTALALALLVLFVLIMQRTGGVGSSPLLRWALVGCAVVIVVLRGIARRARR